jgi:hypothetical protein
MRNGVNKAAVLVLLMKCIYDIPLRVGLDFDTRSKFSEDRFRRSEVMGGAHADRNSRVVLSV